MRAGLAQFANGCGDWQLGTPGPPGRVAVTGEPIDVL
jgi:hypothetical protein